MSQTKSIVARLKGKVPADKALAAESLAALAMEKARRQPIVTAGALPLLVELLRTGTPEGRLHSAGVLARLSEDAHIRTLIVSEDALPALIEVLKDGTGLAKANAAGCISWLANDKPTRALIVAAGGVPLLVDVCVSGTDNGKANSAGALAWLADDKATRQRIVGAGALAPLIEEMANGPEQGQTNAASAISRLGEPDLATRKLIWAAGARPPLILLAANGTPEGKLHAAACLAWKVDVEPTFLEKYFPLILAACLALLLAVLLYAGLKLNTFSDSAKFVREHPVETTTATLSAIIGGILVYALLQLAAFRALATWIGTHLRETFIAVAAAIGAAFLLFFGLNSSGDTMSEPAGHALLFAVCLLLGSLVFVALFLSSVSSQATGLPGSKGTGSSKSLRVAAKSEAAAAGSSGLTSAQAAKYAAMAATAALFLTVLLISGVYLAGRFPAGLTASSAAASTSAGAGGAGAGGNVTVSGGDGLEKSAGAFALASTAAFGILVATLLFLALQLSTGRKAAAWIKAHFTTVVIATVACALFAIALCAYSGLGGNGSGANGAGADGAGGNQTGEYMGIMGGALLLASLLFAILHSSGKPAAFLRKHPKSSAMAAGAAILLLLLYAGVHIAKKNQSSEYYEWSEEGTIPRPTAWSQGGGSWRAMTAGMGLGRAFHNAGLLIDPTLQMVSGSSGGALFLSQLAYSPRFYAEITSNASMDGVVVDWLKGQMSILETPSKTEINAWLGDGNEGQATTALLDVLRGVRKTTPPVERWLCHDQNICLQVLDEVTSALNMGGHFEGSWSLYVQEMLKLHDASLATAEATKQARTGSLLAPELRFQLATMTSSSVKGPATEDTSSVSWLTTADGRKSTYDMMPMQYVVPGNLSPPKSVQRFEQSAATKATGVKTVTTMPSTSMQISTNTPEMLGGETPTVSQVAAMSSAYAALFGSLHMVEKFANAEYEHLIQDHWLAAWTGAGPPRELEGNPLREQVEGLATFYNTSSYPSGCRNLFTLGVCTEVTWGKLMPCVNAVLAKCALPALTTYLADHAVCAHDSSSVDPEFDTRICDFPAVRVAEGGMVDSSSSAQSLGALQKSNPGKTLRMVISTSEDCEDRLTCAHDALKQLFSHEEKSLHMQASRPVPQVFGTAWAIVKDHLQPIPGTQYGVHAKLRTTTVTNDLYGVAGGTHVEVLLLSFDAPLSLLKTASVSAKSMRAMGVYANDAASTPVSLLVGTWMNATRTATIVVEEIA